MTIIRKGVMLALLNYLEIAIGWWLKLLITLSLHMSFCQFDLSFPNVSLVFASSTEFESLAHVPKEWSNIIFHFLNSHAWFAIFLGAISSSNCSWRWYAFNHSEIAHVELTHNIINSSLSWAIWDARPLESARKNI